jgi:hypothetical protein
MHIKIYYKDPDAISDSIGVAMQEKYPDVKLYSKEYWDKCKEFMKSLVKTYGELVSSDEDLRITVDTDDSELIDVNGSKYRLVT